MNKRKYCKMCGRRITENNLAKASIVYKLLSAIKIDNEALEGREIAIDICTPCATKTLYFLEGGKEDGND